MRPRGLRGLGPARDDDGCDSADGSPSSRGTHGLAPSGAPDYMTDTGLRVSTAVKETRLGTPSTAATAAKRSREPDLEQVFKTPRTTLGGSSRSSAAAIEETPDTAVASSSASAAATDGLLAELRANILALKATDPLPYRRGSA